MKVSVVLGVLLATVMTFSLQAIENKAVLYDAASINNPAVQCSTCTWIEHSDFKPVQTIVEHKGEKWLQFKFEGTQGSGRAVIHFKDTIAELIPEGMTAYGLEVTIDYPEKDFRKLQISPYFKDGKRFTQHLPLEDGVKTYSFESGFSRTEIPKDWSALTSIALFMSAGFPEFHVKKIAVKLYPKQVTEKRLTIQRIRKISEVLPGKDRVTLDFGGDEPFQAQVGYDQNHLYVTSRAKFPSKPRANFKADDKVGSVWGDELTEYFFSGWNDNQKYIQFVFNLNGVSWDSITDYDKTAAMVIRNITNWNLQHTKKIKWEDGFWTTEAAFPFEALRFDSPAQRFMGFQIVQQYGKEHGEKYQTAVWSPSQSFPDPRNFGILVFNQTPFGTGTLFPEVASAQLDRANDKVDFSMNVNVEDVKPGTYTLRKYIAAADHSFIELPSETVEVVSSREVLKVSYKACKNLNGIYSLYAALENAHGDMRMTAINFDNSKPLVSLFGESVFCPTPKKITWHEGVFEAGKHHTLSIPENASQRTAKTAAILAEKILGYAGIYNVVEGEDSGIVLRVASTVMSNGEMLELSPEGYYLQVMPEKVVITGADEAGLYYGCRIFLQMLRQPMKRQAAAPIRCAEILDWPDLEKRFTNMLHPWQFYGRGFNEKRSMDYLINWVDRYVAGTGQNMFILNVGPIVEYKRRPEFNSVNCLYTLDDLEKLAQFCRDHFIEFVPRWQTGGHANWFLLSVHPELRENGYKNTADVTHPEHNAILFDCMLDVIEATQCKYLHVGGDEWWHSLEPSEKPDELLRGKTRAQAFLDFHKEAFDFTKKHGVRMMMHEDMLNPYHNGVRYDLYTIIDQMPKEIIISPWGGSNPDRTLQYFIDHGFQVWPNTTGTWFPNKSRQYIGGYGPSVYSFSWSLRLVGSKVHVNYALNVFRGAEYAWNAYSDKHENIEEWVSSGLLPALAEQFSEPWNPAAAPSVRPLDIGNALNTDFNKLLLKREAEKYAGKEQAVKLSAGEVNVGNVPMLLAGDGKNCIRIGQGETVSLAVSGKFSSLVFLHTVRTDDAFLQENQAELIWRHWIYGRPAGDYIVKYTDGSSIKIPLRLRDNINICGIKPLLRSCLNSRFVMPLKDATGSYLFLYQYEWVNPNPEKAIASVELTQTVVDFDMLLFAVSGRDVKP